MGVELDCYQEATILILRSCLICLWLQDYFCPMTCVRSPNIISKLQVFFFIYFFPFNNVTRLIIPSPMSCSNCTILFK